MSHKQLIENIADMRWRVERDRQEPQRIAVSVDLPGVFRMLGYDDSMHQVVTVGGFRSQSAAVSAVPSILQEVIVKMLAAELTPETDAPMVRPGSFIRIIKVPVDNPRG